MNKEKAQNFINRGHIINKSSGYQQFLLMLIVLLFTTGCLILNKDFVRIIIYFAITFFIVLAIVCLYIKEKKKFYNRFFTYSLSMLFIAVSCNFVIYAAMIGLNSFSLSLLLVTTLLQIAFLVICIFFIIIVAKNKRNKSYIAAPFVTTGIGYAAFFAIKYSIKGASQETGIIMINLVFCIASIMCLYYASTSIIKWYFAKKYNIIKYNDTINLDNDNNQA